METADALSARLCDPGQCWHVPLQGSFVSCLTPIGDSHLAVATQEDHLLSVFEIRPPRQEGPPLLVAQLALARPATCLACDSFGSGAAVFCGAGASSVERLHFSLGAAQGDKGSLAIVDGDQTPRVPSQKARVTALAAADGWLYSIGNDFCIRMWDIQTGGHWRTLAEGVSPASSLAVAAGGQLLLSASHEGAGAISMWRFMSSVRSAERGRAWCLAPLAALAGLGANAAGLTETALQGLECVHSFALAGDMVHVAALLPGECAALSASHTGEIKVWDLVRKRLTAEYDAAHFGHATALSALALVGRAVCSACSSQSGFRVTHCSGEPRTSGADCGAEANEGVRQAIDATGASGDAVAAGLHERDVEAVLRGVEEAADELALG